MDASAKPRTTSPTRELAFMCASTARLNPRSFLDGLLRRDDRLLLDRIAGVAPLFQRITDEGAVRLHRRGALEVEAVDVRLLINFRVLPRVDDREPLAVSRQFEPLDEARFRRANAAAGNGSGRKPGRLDHERAAFVAADRMPRRSRHPLARIGMTAAIQINVPHAPALAGEDDFVLVLDEVHAARIRVDQDAAVAAAAEETAARLRDDDVRNAFRIRTG